MTTPSKTGLALIWTLITLFVSMSAAHICSAGEISVSGEAEIKVFPDEVVLMLGIDTLDKDLTRAKKATTAASSAPRQRYRAKASNPSTYRLILFVLLRNMEIEQERIGPSQHFSDTLPARRWS